MYFFADFEADSQDILRKVGQEAAFKDAEKGAKNELLELRDRFIHQPISVLFPSSQGFFSK
jgi:hypothetical protein